MQNIRLCLHPTKLTTKQEANAKVGKITKELAHYDCEISFEDFIEAVGQGQTWSGGIFSPLVKKSANWVCQQCFAIDVDNNDGDNITPAELIDHYAGLNYKPNGFYYSLSSSRKKLKFRLIWILEKTISDSEKAKFFKQWLIVNSLGYADSCTINLDRLYFGGKNSEIIHEAPIKLAKIPQEEIRKKKSLYKPAKVANTILNPNEMMATLAACRIYIADPSKKYLTRYKTVFNCAVQIYVATNTAWDEDRIYGWIVSRMEDNPKVWADYHHDLDDVYEWVSRACDWALENCF
ncbi:MAG: hypothetical protein QNJ16_19680 [Rhodobacter sp.]|nr:hypothetical protein [Rhodobacter sp.]